MKTFRFTSCYHYICLEKFLALRCSLVREDMYFSTQKFDLVTQLLVFMEKPFVFPVPLTPMIPTFSPSCSENDAPSNNFLSV